MHNGYSSMLWIRIIASSQLKLRNPVESGGARIIAQAIKDPARPPGHNGRRPRPASPQLAGSGWGRCWQARRYGLDRATSTGVTELRRRTPRPGMLQAIYQAASTVPSQWQRVSPIRSPCRNWPTPGAARYKPAAKPANQRAGGDPDAGSTRPQCGRREQRPDAQKGRTASPFEEPVIAIPQAKRTDRLTTRRSS